MKRKYKYNRIGLMIFATLASHFALALSPAGKLQNLLNQTHSMQANFTQKSYDGDGITATMRGRMALLKPGKFRWEIRTPNPVLMVSNGTVLWIYQKNLKQVSVSKIDANQKNDSAANILSNRIRLLGNYFTVWQKNNWFYLNPKYNVDNLKQVQLYFKGRKLTRMWILDKLGQRSLLTFSNIKLNHQLNLSLFKFHPPRGVDVVRGK